MEPEKIMKVYGARALVGGRDCNGGMVLFFGRFPDAASGLIFKFMKASI